MSLTTKDVQKVAKLSRIAVGEARTQSMTDELNNILGWIEQLQEVDVDGVPPMTGVGNNALHLRRDEVTDGNCVDDVLGNAPKSEFNCYVVPKVVDQG